MGRVEKRIKRSEEGGRGRIKKEGRKEGRKEGSGEEWKGEEWRRGKK